MAEEHYFSPHPTPPSQRQQIVLSLPDVKLDLVSDSGVFSAPRIDSGTLVLLRHGPPPPMRGNILDLGCGYGAIAITLAKRAPATAITAIDVNHRAVSLARENAENNQAVNVKVMAPEDVPAALRFDAIYCNPPIRIGRAALIPLLREWLSRLQPDGFAAMVVHRHLGSDSLAKRLESLGFAVRRLSSHAGYRILEVRQHAAGLPKAG